MAKLIPSDGAEDFGFGHSVSISGDNAIVGTIPMGGAESAYIFSRNQGGNDNWGEVKKLVASDGNIGDSFGFSVSISGDNAIVSAPIESLEGSTYVFSRNMGGNNNWGEKEKLKPVGLALQDLYGANIVIAQDTIVIGAVEDRPLGIGSA